MMQITPQSADPTLQEMKRADGRRRQRNNIVRAILIPVAIALFYYLLIARVEYQTHSEFTIQGTHKSTPDILSGIGIPAASPATNDARIVSDYIRSAEMVDLLRKRYGFNEAYGGFTFDLAGHLSEDASIERAVRFWGRHLKVDYDVGANVIVVSVSAFRPEDAKRLADGVLAGATGVVNKLDMDAQNAALRFAKAQLSDQKHTVDLVRQRVTGIRGAKAMTLDARTAQSVQAIGQIDAELARLRVQAATAAATFQPGTAQARAVDSQIAALEQARRDAVARAQAGPGEGVAVGDIAARTALLDYEFAQKSYYAALQAFQAARNQSDSGHRYIVAFIPPRVPETSNYFSRLWNVLAIAIAAAVLMSTGMLTYSVIKDHMQ